MRAGSLEDDGTALSRTQEPSIGRETVQGYYLTGFCISLVFFYIQYTVTRPSSWEEKHIKIPGRTRIGGSDSEGFVCST